MTLQDIIIAVILIVIAYMYGYWKRKADIDFENEHSKCICPKCHTEHRKGINYEQQN